jgi:hypothetical protein
MRRHPLVWHLLISLFAVACGQSEPTGDSAPGAGKEAWWVLRAPDFRLVAGGRHPTDRGWSLEYSNGPTTLQITAFEQQIAPTDRILGDTQVVGQATAEGFELTLRRSTGIPEDGIPPSLSAEWTDQGVLMLFGSTKDEAALRSRIAQLSKVDRTRWDAELAKIPARVPFVPGPSSTIVPRSTTSARP